MSDSAQPQLTTVEITVPPMKEREDGKPPFTRDFWRRTVTGLKPGATGIESVRGEWLSPGDVVRLPVGTLVLVVDQEVAGWRDSYQPYSRGRYMFSGSGRPRRVPEKEATVAVHLVTPAGLSGEPLWEYHYLRAKSAVGAKSRTKLAALLEQHPAPGGDVTVVREAQRPNRRDQDCRRCSGPVRAGEGHLVGRGADAVVEHFEECPPRTVVGGEACVLCGIGVIPLAARKVFVRDGDGGTWEVRHLPWVDCTAKRPESYEEYREAQREAQRRSAQQAREHAERVRRSEEQQARRRAKRQAEREARRREEEAARRAHLERIAGLKTLERTSAEVTSKGLDAFGRRARLLEHTDRLEGGLATTRWGVELVHERRPDEGHSLGDFDAQEEARDLYRELRYEKHPTFEWGRAYAPGLDCWCPGEDVLHCHHCGARLADGPDGFVMNANLGPACSHECYDAQSDDRGGHAKRWHGPWG